MLRPGVAESRFEALHAAALTPLVGREEELALLVRRWAQAKAGEGRVVLLSGEPGIGKSRLLASLEERIEGEPHVRLRYFCSSHHQASALQPVRAQLERAAGFGREDPPEARLAKLEALLSPAPAEDVALVAELLSVPGGERYPPPDLAPQRKRARTFAALLQQLEALARRGPVVSIFEDAHWIDPSTRELLDLTVERVAHLPVLLVVTVPARAAAALDRPAARDHAGPEPPRPERRRRAGRGVAGARCLPDHVLDEIVERADGVPLFVEELTKAVVETGGGEAAGRVIAAVSPAALALPATLHASLLARLDRLGPAAREVAQIGAAIGRDFAFELLSAVADSKDSELASALAQLVGAGLVFQRGALPEASFVFKHTLVQDVAYGTLLRDRRRELHARIATAIEERFPEAAEATPELIAHHFTEAGLADRAVRRWLTAGQRAAGRSADWEAVRHLRRGLEALATLPPTPERDRLELDFQLALGPPLVSISGFTDAEADAAFERAAQLCEGQGDTARLVMPLFGLFQHRLVGGRCLAARAIAERLRALADRGGDPVHRLVSHRALGTVATATGSLAEARAELEAVAAIYDARRDQALVARYSTDPGASGLAFLALVLWVSGFPEQARRASRDAIRAARGLEHVNTTCHVRLFAGAHLAELLRDPTAAEAEADAVIALAAEHRLPSWQNRGRILRGWALGQTGRVKEGLALMRQGMAELDRLGTSWHRPHQVALLAELCARVGDPATGLRLVVEEAHEQVRRTGEGFWAADLYRVEGRLRRLTGAPADEVEACFEAALSLARQQGAKSYELRAATSLARLRRDQGRRREALDLLAPVHAWFTEGLDTPDLRDAEALLAELR